MPALTTSSRSKSRPSWLFLCVGSLLGCASEAEEDRDLGSPVENNPCDIPVDDLTELSAWLEDERYLTWTAESAVHDSSGPHFGNVRTWISSELEASLAADADVHPVCSAAVKELYGDDQARGGWSLSVKIADSGGKSDWFWYEVYESESYAEGTDVDVCTNCHRAGVDFVLTPFPLQ